MDLPQRHHSDNELPESDSPVTKDDRSRTRYSIVTDVGYSLYKAGRVVRRGHGKTLNLSSTGLLIETNSALPPDRRISVSVAWPVMLSPGVGLSLQVTGRTVRAQGNCTAVRIEKYEFRVRALESCVQTTVSGR